MINIAGSKTLESLSLEEIDSLEISEAGEIINKVESNTKWEDTSLHATHSKDWLKICKPK